MSTPIPDPLTDETIRERIIRRIVDMLSEMKAGLPAADPYRVDFTKVVEGDPGSDAKVTKAIAAVYDGQETTTPLTHRITTCLLVVDVVVHAHYVAGEPPLKTARRYVGEVRRLFARQENRQLGGLCVDVLPVSFDLTEEGVYASTCEGVARFNIMYRHHIEDPRRLAS